MALETERNEENENVTSAVDGVDTGDTAGAGPAAATDVSENESIQAAQAENTPAAEESAASLPETQESEAAVPAAGEGVEAVQDTAQPAPAANTGNVENADPVEKNVYRWTYPGQREANEQAAKKKKSGLGLYIAMVSAMFAVCLLILVVVLAVGGKITAANYVGGDGTRVVFVHDGEGEDTSLTSQEIALAVSPAVVGIHCSVTGGVVSEGAGVILTEDGYILTNYHVIQGATSVIVYLYGENGQVQENFYRAKMVGAKPECDLAVLKIEADMLPTVTFGDSDSVLVGDTVYAVGHPGGLEFGWTFSDGVVSGVNRTVTNEYNYQTSVIQSNVTVNTGNSGGPLLNDKGEVIGIITMKLTGDYQGMNFALPGNEALATAQDVIENGGVTDETNVINRPYVGITGCTATAGTWLFYNEETGGIYTVTDEEQAALLGATYITEDGVFVVSVMEDSGAYEHLKPGDVIIAVDGIAIGTMDNMIQMLSGYNVGDEVLIKYIRDGETRVDVIVLTEQNQ